MDRKEEKIAEKPLQDDIDLMELVGKVLSKWKFVLGVTVCFMVIGLIMALTAIKEYTAQVVVAPETSKTSKVGGLGSLASMAGFDMGAFGGEEAIYPLLYPDIVQSLPFMSSLFDVKVKSQDGVIDTTYFKYVRDLRKKSLADYVKGIPSKVKNGVIALFSSEGNAKALEEFNPYHLTRSQMYMIQQLNEKISILIDKKTDVITVSFTEQDPLIAATMVDTIMCRLQNQITAYRTKKVIDDCAYIEKLYLQSKGEYERAQDAYASYVDRNRNVTQERFLVEKERLSADKDLKNTLYTQWAQQLMLSKAKVQEYTPVFVTLKPVAVPALASSMSRSMILVMYTFLGGVLAVVYVLLKDYTVDLFKQLFRKE